jgi:hypothetical protein
MLTVPNLGEQMLLNAATGKVAATTLTLRLYTAVSPAIGPGTIGAHVTEAAGGGYTPKPLTAATWTTTSGTPTITEHPQQSFLFDGPLTGNPTILGYFITSGDGTVVVIEPITPTTPPELDYLDVTPVIALGAVIND